MLVEKPVPPSVLTAATNLNFKVSVPTSYITVVEAMGSGQVDVGWLAPFAYVLAHDKFQSTVILASVRGGSKTYTGQIITLVQQAYATNNFEATKNLFAQENEKGANLSDSGNTAPSTGFGLDADAAPGLSVPIGSHWQPT